MLPCWRVEGNSIIRRRGGQRANMDLLRWSIFLTAVYPLARMWRANWNTSLLHAAGWATAAWLGWGTAMAAGAEWPEMAPAARHVGLCLIGCAGVAVLGARRPGVDAWNFVVAGLLAVLLLSLAEGALAGGEARLSPPRILFLAGTLAVGVLNYLPTRRAGAALLLAVGCGLELGMPKTALTDWLFLLVPWAALGMGPSRHPVSEVDRLWLDFRDRFGLVWGQRLREQFHRAASHAGLPFELGWNGLRSDRVSSSPDDAALSLLRALMKRFGPADPEEDQPTGL